MDYTFFSQAAQAILEANGPSMLSAIYAPRTFAELDRLTDSTGQPLQSPRSFQAMRHFITNQVPTDLGAGTNETEVYIGDFANLWVGMRTDARIETSRTAEDAFSKLEVLVRIYARLDIAVVRPAHFAVVHGLVPAA